MEHKVTAYRHHISRIHSLPLTPHRKLKEWATIQLIAQNNNFPQIFVQWLNHQIQHKHTNKDHTNSEQQEMKTWTTFIYVGHLENKERLRIQPAQLFNFS